MLCIQRIFPGCVIAIALASLLFGCVPEGTRPLVVINSPPSGTTLDANTEILVQVSASDPGGIARIELWANNFLLVAETNTTVGTQGIFSTVFHWIPQQPGTFTLEAKAYSRSGEMSFPASISILVRPGSARPPITATPSPTPTLIPSTPTRTLTPGIVTTTPLPATLIPPTPTFTSTPTALPPTQVPTATPTPTNAPTATPTPTNAPTTAPPPPSGFSATVTGQTTADVTWADNTNDEEGFKVYRNLSGSDALIGQRGANAGTGNTTFALTGLACSEEYKLYAKSFKGLAESLASNSATIVTDPCTPTSVAAPSHTGQTLNVTWTDNSTTPEETGFNIYFGNTLKKSVPAHAGTGAMSTTLAGLDCGTAYADLRVSTVYNGRESPKSSPAANETTGACQIKVEFTRVDIKEDTHFALFSPGDMRLTFTVEGITQSWPSATGSKTIRVGGHEDFSVVFNTTAIRNNTISTSIRSQDIKDNPGDLGTVTATFPGTQPGNFGAGAHQLENRYFKIYFTITVTSPP